MLEGVFARCIITPTKAQRVCISFQDQNPALSQASSYALHGTLLQANLATSLGEEVA